MKSFARASWSAFILAACAFAAAQLKPLDHSVYDDWKSIQGRTMSRDGAWAAWSLTPQEGDSVAEVKSLSSSATHRIDRVSALRFSYDSGFLLGTQAPKFAEARDARRARKPANEQPKNSLVILNLKSGKQEVVEKVSSWSLPAKGGNWVMYRPDTGTAAPAGPAGAGGRPGGRPGGRLPGASPDEEGDYASDQAAVPAQQPEPSKEGKPEEPKKKPDHPAGSDYILRALETGKEVKIADCASFTWNEKGTKALVVLSTKDGKGDGLFLWDFTGSEPKSSPILTGLGRYPRAVFSEDESKVAFFTDRDTYSEKNPESALYVWDGKSAQKILTGGDKRIPEGMRLLSTGLSFDKAGAHLEISLQPKPQPEPTLPHEEDRVSLDVWHWKDPQTQLAQLRTAAAERGRSFLTRVNLKSGSLVQLATKELPSVRIPSEGEPAYGLVLDGDRYQMQSTWGDGSQDVYLIHLATGTKRLIAEGLKGTALFSPDGSFLILVDAEERQIYAVKPATGEKTSLVKGLPNLFDEDADRPSLSFPYGFGGFTKEGGIVVYDKWDAWLLDLKGGKSPVCITRGMGKATETEYRLVTLNSESPWLDTSGQALFTRTENKTKEVSYAQGDFTGRTSPKTLIKGPMVVSGLMKAEGAEKYTYTKQSFSMFPDVWTSDLTFAKETRLSDANPQKSQYLWGTSELVEYYSNDGIPLQGVLIKPGGFDPTKQYPMVVYFYETSSQNLHRFVSPSPSASTINPSFFASNGYVVFMPDIPYKEGYPGESAMNAILPGTQKVLSMGFVDPKKIGLQGQSWGGYQVAYLVTESNMFAAASAGAAVSNMTSAYSGIRYGSGVLRQMQYEAGQSRIGKNLWEAPLRYLENSPVFFADKIKTPLLLMNNDQDGAVPWTEGIQLFAALRRLQRPCWLLVYNGEDHNLVQRKNRKDLSIRLSQFFDHYLKGAPMPVWMESGIPATEKGRTMGLEIPKKP